MTGPVWRFEAGLQRACDSCLREHAGLYVEGEVVDNELLVGRAVCPACYRQWHPALVCDNLGRPANAPAYARGR